MKSAKLKLFLCLLLGGIFFVLPAYALDGNVAPEASKKNLADIKTRLEALEKQQAEIIAKEDKILEELAIVKIWVHRK